MAICSKCNDFSLTVTKIYKGEEAVFLCPDCLQKEKGDE